MTLGDVASLLFTAVCTALLVGRMNQLERQSRKHHEEMMRATHARQSNAAAQRTSRQNPRSDAEARTTRRDTADLPRTGRMSQPSHITRKGGESLERQSDDRGLHQGPGSPPAQVG